MKNTFYIYIWIFGMLLVTLTACHKKNNTKSDSTPLSELPHNVPSCEVTTSKGTLYSFYRNNFVCSSIGGLPYCQISPKNGDSLKYDMEKSTIEITSDMIPLYDKHIHFIAEDLHNDKAAQALANIKQLFVDNDYKISTPDLIKKYYDNFIIYTEFYKKQSLRIRDKLDGDNIKN